MKKYLILSTALLTIFVIGSCKKDNSTTEGKPSLSGLSINAAPAFVAVGDEFTFRANISSLGVSKGTLPTVGLYWQVNTAKKDTLTRDAAATNPEYHYKVDSLGTYSVYCYAFGGSNYYNTSASSSFRAVLSPIPPIMVHISGRDTTSGYSLPPAGIFPARKISALPLPIRRAPSAPEPLWRALPSSEKRCGSTFPA